MNFCCWEQYNTQVLLLQSMRIMIQMFRMILRLSWTPLFLRYVLPSQISSIWCSELNHLFSFANLGEVSSLEAYHGRSSLPFTIFYQTEAVAFIFFSSVENLNHVKKHCRSRWHASSHQIIDVWMSAYVSHNPVCCTIYWGYSLDNSFIASAESQ